MKKEYVTVPEALGQRCMMVMVFVALIFQWYLKRKGDVE